jgi:hypothetical protein
MKKSFIALLALLFFGMAAQQAQAGEFLWKHFGVAKYADSHEVAMDTREQAFQCLGVTDPAVISALIALTNQHGQRLPLNNGDHIGTMLSKGCVAHENTTVAFTAPVHNMEYAAPSERWQIRIGSRTYILTLPDICNNWSLLIIDTPPPPPPPPPPIVKSDCVTGFVHLAEIPQDATNIKVTYGYAGSHELAPSACHFKGQRACLEQCDPLQSAEQDAEDYAATRHWDLEIAFRDVREFDLDAVGTHLWMRVVLSSEIMDNYSMFAACIEYTENGRRYRSVRGKAVVFNPRDPNRKFELQGFTFEEVPGE